MKFLAKLTEALETPELPEKDSWGTGPRWVFTALRHSKQTIRDWIDSGFTFGWMYRDSSHPKYDILVANADDAESAFGMMYTPEYTSEYSMAIEDMRKGRRVDLRHYI